MQTQLLSELPQCYRQAVGKIARRQKRRLTPLSHALSKANLKFNDLYRTALLHSNKECILLVVKGQVCGMLAFKRVGF